MGFLSSVLDFLFPPKCMFCRKVLRIGQKGCCDVCQEKLVVDTAAADGCTFYHLLCTHAL